MTKSLRRAKIGFEEAAVDVMLRFVENAGLEGIRVGIAQARGLRWDQSPGDGRLASLLDEARTRAESLLPPSRKAAVRDMLRYGIYKPAGRAKPSNEYLLQAALEGDFPAVNYFVDAVNVVSLLFGYPISIIDLGKAGSELLLRRGRVGESYVFNSGGQTIELADLLCVCRKTQEGFVPTANPVRDSMATKLFPGAAAAAAFIYAPSGAEGRDLEKATESLASYLGEAAEACEWGIAP